MKKIFLFLYLSFNVLALNPKLEEAFITEGYSKIYENDNSSSPSNTMYGTLYIKKGDERFTLYKCENISEAKDYFQNQVSFLKSRPGFELIEESENYATFEIMNKIKGYFYKDNYAGAYDSHLNNTSVNVDQQNIKELFLK